MCDERIRSHDKYTPLLDSVGEENVVFFTHPSEFLVETTVIRHRLMRKRNRSLFACIHHIYTWEIPRENE